MSADMFKCPICDSADSRLWGVEHTGYRILKCRSCGLRYLDPEQRPRDELYDQKYFDHKASKMLEPQKLLQVFKSDADSIALIERFSVRGHDPRSSILDIGAGRGSFLILCKLLGFKCLTGTDITNSNVEYLHDYGIELKVGDITELELGKYDIITFYHVLEHIPDQKRFLMRIHEILNDGGIAHLPVPNEGSPNSRFKSMMSRLGLKKRAFKHLSPGHHLWYFEKQTLIALLKSCGFEIKYVGSRAHEKRRGMMNRTYHRMLDMFGLNTWLEVVVGK
jgi:2-polyprenyl-3-methyl-5-hydroxy-6-metoxy-1,4-benzoquinol methylase